MSLKSIVFVEFTGKREKSEEDDGGITVKCSGCKQATSFCECKA